MSLRTMAGFLIDKYSQICGKHEIWGQNAAGTASNNAQVNDQGQLEVSAALKGSIMELDRHLNIEVTAGASVDITIYADVSQFPKFYLICIPEASHDYGVQVTRSISGNNTFGLDIDVIDGIVSGVKGAKIGEILELKSQSITPSIVNNDVSTHHYDLIVMGVAVL